MLMLNPLLIYIVYAVFNVIKPKGTVIQLLKY